MAFPKTDTTYSGLPAQYREGMRRYIEEGILPGFFLVAILSNDLYASVAQCSGPMDDVKSVVRWIYNEAPSRCWGSPEQVRDWILGVSTTI